MTSSRPYLLRAIYEWILDNNMTPFLLVDTTITGVHVPEQYIENNRILLNILPEAVHQMVIGNEAVTFNARFNNKPCKIYVPVSAVISIYTKETGDGIVFSLETETASGPGSGISESAGSSNKVKLKVIK